jgi:hypothetical protein
MLIFAMQAGKTEQLLSLLLVILPILLRNYLSLGMDELNGHIEYMDVPEEYREVQQSIDSFVRVNYDTARGMLISMQATPADITAYRGKIVDIIRNNPPLASVPKYLRDGREDYLWYSDFYDDITKEVYHKYRIFQKPDSEITPANYAEELAKVDLPYFKELVNLISLERLCMDYEEKISGATNEINQPEEELPTEEQPVIPEAELEPNVKPQSKRKQLLGKRSYEPKLTNKQYALLAECVEAIKLFRRPVKVAVLKKLLKGKLLEPLQVTNQKSLVYLLDQLKENKYIKETWMSVAEGNKDFISFRTDGNEQRYGSEPHYITMQQFLNNRRRNLREAISGLESIEDMIELLEENRDK